MAPLTGGSLPIFGAGTARTGAGLVCNLLSVNRDVMVASDPYLELFRSFRNAVVREYGDTEVQQFVRTNMAFPDCYFSDEGVRLLDLVMNAELDLPFDAREWNALLEVSQARIALECADLVEGLSGLLGATYLTMFNLAIDLIMRVRNVEGRKWVGFKECWTIDFFPVFARAYPEARFFSVLRDPRASMASMLAMRGRHPEQVVHSLSWARHWRKHAACTAHYLRDPRFDGRLHIIRHEDLVRDPQEEARRFCDFLDIDYDADMVDTTKYLDYATGGVWKGNSSFGESPGPSPGIEPLRAERWRSSLPTDVLNMVEFVCGPEMALFGYEAISDAGEGRTPEVLEYLIQNNSGTFNWRTDFRDPQLDYGYELSRAELLTTSVADTSLVRRAFLFEDVFAAVRQPQAPLATV